MSSFSYQQQRTTNADATVTGTHYISSSGSKSISSEKYKLQQLQLQQQRSSLERATAVRMYAKKLNNSAAMCVEIGEHDKAIASLAKALRLCELHENKEDDDDEQPCLCYSCSLDGCIAYSEYNSNLAESIEEEQQDSNAIHNAHKKSSKNMIYDHDDPDCGHIYRRPIRIPPQSIQEHHPMGSTLPLIITFNLALVHHLSIVIKGDSNDLDFKNKRRTSINNTLQLYQLTNKWQLQYKSESQSLSQSQSHHESSDDDDSSHCDGDDDSIMSIDSEEEYQDQDTLTRKMDSVRFNMIICNNLSHLYRLVDDDTKSKQCLENLLSTVMLVVDNNNKHTDTVTASSSNYQNNSNVIIANDIDIDFEYCDDEYDNDSQDALQYQSQQTQQSQVQAQRTSFIEVEGFLQNASTIIFEQGQQHADAA